MTSISAVHSTRWPATVTFGLSLTQRFEPELAQRAEELGFARLWVGGHVLWHKPMLDPLVQLTAYGALTTRIGLGSCVLLLPLYHPVTLAKTVTTIDVLTGGRLTLGVGVGGENKNEFLACGVDHSTRGSRTNEAIDVMRALWTGEPTEHHGRFFELPTTTMEPAPVQRGGPPIWVSGRSPAALERAGTRGDGWIGIFLSPPRYREALTALAEQADRAGRDPASITPADYRFVAMTDSTSEGLAAGARYLQSSYRQAFSEDQVRRFCAAGTPEDCRRQIEALIDAGGRHIVLRPACEPAEVAARAEVLAAELL